MPSENTPIRPQNPSYAEISKVYPKQIKTVFYPTDTTDVKDGYSLIVGGSKGGWRSIGVEDDIPFAEFVYLPTANNPESQWKAHLSIHPDDLDRAWDLLYPLLAEESKYKFKVCRQGVIGAQREKIEAADIKQELKDEAFQDQKRVSQGMQITVYIPEGEEERIGRLLKDCEYLLETNLIRPGIIHTSDKGLGTYASIRQITRFDPQRGQLRNYKYEESPQYKATHESDIYKSFQRKPVDLGVISKLNFKEQIEGINERLRVFADAELAFNEHLSQLQPGEKEDKNLEAAMLLNLNVLFRMLARWKTMLSSATPESTSANKELKDFIDIIETAYEFAETKQKALFLRQENPELLSSREMIAHISQKAPQFVTNTQSPSNQASAGNSNPSIQAESTPLLGKNPVKKNSIVAAYEALSTRASYLLAYLQKKMHSFLKYVPGGAQSSFRHVLFSWKNEELNAKHKVEIAKQAQQTLEEWPNNKNAIKSLANTQKYLRYWEQRIDSNPSDFPADFQKTIKTAIKELILKDKEDKPTQTNVGGKRQPS